MNILLTGGSGHIGSFATAYLLSQGHSVRIVDRVAPDDINPEAAERIQGADYVWVDITDFAALRPHFDGIEGVVHLAAIPDPISGKDAEIFHINCGGSFNVYQAAAEAGIKRVVSASSINALGNGYGIKPVPIQYFPIDEAHPGYTTDVYSFSKQVLEEIAAYFWRREGISGACLRFPWVYNMAWFERWRGDSGDFQARRRATFDALMALPETERREQAASMMAQLRTLRERHERGEVSEETMHEEFQKIPVAMLAFGRNDFWAMLDVRDAALAIEKALLAEYEGSHPLWIVSDHNSVGLPTMDLASLMYPDVTMWRHPVPDTKSLVSIDKARELIGFKPEHTFMGFEEEV